MNPFLRIVKNAFTLLLVFVFLCGCSGGNSPALPALNGENGDQLNSLKPGNGEREPGDNSSGHYLWGYYLVKIDPEKYQYEIIPVREITMHVNILKFLEQSPCTDCFKIAGITPGPSGTLNIDISIKHPFATLLLTGFDVRGIAMFNGSKIFPVSGLSMSDSTLGDGELMNADGYTALYNPTTVSHGPLEGYLKGKYATTTAPNATLNGFKRFITDDPANTRNAFYAGDEVTATFQVKMPKPFIFGYAVDSNWAPAKNKPVTDPMTDFGPEANCPESWKIEVQDIEAGLTPEGGTTKLQIDIYDWQGKDDTHPALVECSELFDGEVTAIWKEDGTGYTRYEAEIGNVKLATVGSYSCLISKESKENDTSGKPWLDLTAYQLLDAQVLPVQTLIGWARTWGGSNWDEGNGVAVDGSGNAYVTGDFTGTVDFDPGPGVDNHTSDGGYWDFDIFLSKFDSSGAFKWARTWGGSDIDRGYGVAVDGSGNVYVTGYFCDTVDFDPGSGIDNHTSNGGYDIFLSKFDSSGNFQWERTWGGSHDDEGYGVAVDASGNVYVTGDFTGKVDFDPSSGVDNHYSNWSYDVFLSKFDSSDKFLWARTWGGYANYPYGDTGHGVAVDVSGNVYVTGWFGDTVDFDPGSGVDNHTSNWINDIFLSKFDSSGNFQWARTWGGSSALDAGYGVAVDVSGNVYVTGWFKYTVDFDPGSAVDNHTSNGGYDIFLSKFDSSGAFKWARTWGGIGDDCGFGVAVDVSSNVYVIGRFYVTVDFDPSPAIDNHTSNGFHDIFLSKFKPDGYW